MKIKKINIFIIIYIFLLIPSLFCKDIYVRATSSGNGSRQAPFGQLWKAIFKAQSGDVIHVSQGIYQGRDGGGLFEIKIPNLVLAGGYNNDFSERNPFKYFTILERSSDFDDPFAINAIMRISCQDRINQKGIIIDGFVVNGRSRNKYRDNGELDFESSLHAPLIIMKYENIRIHNCIIINSGWTGIAAFLDGKENEITNCFFINNCRRALDVIANKESAICIANNTFVGVWGCYGIGRAVEIDVHGQAIIENNIIMYTATEAVDSSAETILKNNIFFQCQGGYFKNYNLSPKILIKNSEELEDFNNNPEFYYIKEAGGNLIKDPQLRIENNYARNLTTLLSFDPQILSSDNIQEWRNSGGFLLENQVQWGMAYNLNAVIPNLIYSGNQGAHIEESFAKYKSRTD